MAHCAGAANAGSRHRFRGRQWGASHVPRGSMPGERRGGRTRATPNRRTILADRIVVVLAGCAMASQKQCLSKLVNDAQLPADIRMAIAQKAFPDRTGGVRA